MYVKSVKVNLGLNEKVESEDMRKKSLMSDTNLGLQSSIFGGVFDLDHLIRHFSLWRLWDFTSQFNSMLKKRTEFTSAGRF